MKPIKLSGPEEMIKIASRIAKGEYKKMTGDEQLKAKVVHTILLTEEFMKRLDAVKKLIQIATEGEDSIRRAMGIIADLYTENAPQNLQESLLEQEDRLKMLAMTAKDPDEGFVRELPGLVRDILEPSESLSNKMKK